MKIGAVFPTCEIGNDPVAIRDFAQAAEGLGYSHLLTYDHVLGAVHEGRQPPLAGPYTERDAFHEPFVLYAFLAAHTTHLDLATGVLILPQRQTALVAKQATELDLLSGGRLRLGVGSGWNPVEYRALETDWSTRGARLDEQVELLRRLWAERVVDFEGRFHRVDRAGLQPLPGRRIPIWFGGMSPPAVRRAARLGDGFLFGSTNGFMRNLCRQLADELASCGRDGQAFGIEAIIHWSAGPERWRQELEAWRELGASHFSMRAMDTGAALLGEEPAGFTSPKQHIDALATFAREVGVA